MDSAGGITEVNISDPGFAFQTRPAAVAYYPTTAIEFAVSASETNFSIPADGMPRLPVGVYCLLFGTAVFGVWCSLFGTDVPMFHARHLYSDVRAVRLVRGNGGGGGSGAFLGFSVTLEIWRKQLKNYRCGGTCRNRRCIHSDVNGEWFVCGITVWPAS